MVALEPFPFDRLPRIPRAALAPLQQAARLSKAARGWKAGVDSLAALAATEILVETRDVIWVDARGSERLVLPQHVWALRVELPSGIGVVDLDVGLAAALVDAVLGTAPGPEGAAFRPLRETEVGVLAYLAARFLVASRAHLRGGRLLGWTGDPRALAASLRGRDHVGARFDVSLGGFTYGAWVWLPATSWPAETALPRLDRFADLPVRLRAEVGRARPAMGEVLALAPGDILLCDVAHAMPGPTGRAMLGFPLSRFPRFTSDIIDGRTVRIDSVSPEPEVVPMTSPTESPVPASATNLAAEIPVEVTVELGRANLTVAAVASLAPGEVVVLDRAPTDPVTLAIGDRLIGHGELVVVEGQVGVRVIDVAR
ncbi:MAG: type III secretion system cytoplasmic ring protein SctQ [Deltaproteobacteria bacterium]|nr:type III secretion system cytoplasmic ring protein SctQ [Deltaproteobacteria bacterium]